MSNNKGLSKEIPETEYTFVIDLTGEITNKRYQGEFTCKIPTKKDQCMIDKHRAFLNGDIAEQLSPSTVILHHRIAYLRYTLKNVPKFWRDADLGYGLYDSNVVDRVYEEVLSFERRWLTEIWGEEGMKKFEVEPESDEQEPTKETA